MTEERPRMAASASEGESTQRRTGRVDDFPPLVLSRSICFVTHHKYLAAPKNGGTFFVFTFGLNCPTLFMFLYDLPWGMRCGFSRGIFSELMAVFVGVFRLDGFLFFLGGVTRRG